MNFVKLAQETCNGCDLVKDETLKMSTEEVIAECADKPLTLKDFATCVIDDKTVGVVTFVETGDKYYWCGQSLTSMVLAFIDSFEDERAARDAYAAELKAKRCVKMQFTATKTKSGHDFVQVTVL